LIWLPAILWMAAIFVVSSIPDVPTPPGGFSDSTLHAAEYSVLSLLVLRALAGGRWHGVRWSTAILAVVLSTAYGVSDEWHQAFVPGRTSEWRDVISDLRGAAIAAGAAWAWSIIRHFSQPRERRHGVHEPPPRT
jgi:VanZ family protein